MAYSSAAANTINVVTATAAKTQPAAWVALCSKTAPLISSGVFLAPVPTIANIVSTKSVGSLPFLPYSSMVVNAFLWTLYGILNSESKIYSPNAFGLFMGIQYCIQYKKYVPKHKMDLPGTMKQHMTYGSLIMIMTSLIALGLERHFASIIIGKLAVLVCIVLFVSPLSTLKEVIMTKSAKSIALPFTLACMLNCFLWTVSGIFDMKDFNVYFPNVLGLVSSIAQFVLKLVYGNGKGGSIASGNADEKKTLPL